ncbi:MAG: ATP-binding protein [Clostridiales bacterium]|jgi:predicted AAA+ superfamily ATPase|nr:ATP-binding protein [Clostridiales bacterium]
MEKIKRESYLKQIRPFVDTDLVKVLIGFRRSGKSVLLEQIRDELKSQNIIYVNFEELENEHLLHYKSLNDYIMNIAGNSKEKFYVFLDEIQEVEEWEKVVNSLRAKPNFDVYITGSNSKLLSSDLATYLGGRYISIEVFPFSYKEYKEQNPDNTLDDYIKHGGMPFLSQIGFDADFGKKYLVDVFNSVVLKDIAKRHKIRDIELLERIIGYALANVGKTFSANSITKFFKSEGRIVAPETIMNYLNYCEAAFLFYRLGHEHANSKRMLQVNDKYYVVDHGLREAVTGKNLESTEIILENIVHLELLRRGYKVKIGVLDNNDWEIDFVAEKEGEDKLYLQICYKLDGKDTVDREFRSLLEVKDNYPKYVLYKESSLKGNLKGIPPKNIEDWLLEQ